MLHESLHIDGQLAPGEDGEIGLLRAMVRQAVDDAASYASILATRDASKWRDEWLTASRDLWECLDAIIWLRSPATYSCSYRWCCEMLGHHYKPRDDRLELLLAEVQKAIATKVPSELPRRPKKKKKQVLTPLKAAA